METCYNNMDFKIYDAYVKELGLCLEKYNTKDDIEKCEADYNERISNLNFVFNTNELHDCIVSKIKPSIKQPIKPSDKIDNISPGAIIGILLGILLVILLGILLFTKLKRLETKKEHIVKNYLKQLELREDIVKSPRVSDKKTDFVASTFKDSGEPVGNILGEDSGESGSYTIRPRSGSNSDTKRYNIR